MAQIEQIELKESIGTLPASESKDAINSLGVAYQLVTDHTAMIVLDDATHASRGIERRNQQRVALERTAQSVRAAQPVTNYQVDAQQPTYPAPAPHVSHRLGGGGGGGGALEPVDLVMLVGLLGLVGAAYLGRRALSQKAEKQ